MKSRQLSVWCVVAAFTAVLYGSNTFAQDMKGPPLPFHTIEGVGGGAF